MTRILLYIVIIGLSQYYPIIEGKPFVSKVAFALLICVSSEVLFIKGYKKLWKISISYLLILFVVNTVTPFIYFNILSGDAAMALWRVQGTHLIQFQLDYLYAAVHLTAWSMTYWGKAPKFRFILLFALSFFAMNLVISDVYTRVLTHCFSLFVASFWFTRSRSAMGYSKPKEMVLIFCYLSYSVILINSELVGTKNYVNFNYSYILILSVALMAIQSSKQFVYDLLHTFKWRFLLLVPCLYGAITSEYLAYQLQFVILMGMLYWSMRFSNKYFVNKQLGNLEVVDG